MISSEHPYWHVRSVVESRVDIAFVPLSYYTYVPRTVADTRRTWLVSRLEFLNERHIHDAMNSTPAGQELAVHSDLRLVDGTALHLAMVDMSTTSKAHLAKLRAFLDEGSFEKIAWYSSGRSFHGYGSNLLAMSEWIRFMGLLLLANQPRLEPTVDPRWIGHRLVAGYAALRWTRNTPHYLGIPFAVESSVRTSSSSLAVGPLGRPLRSGRA